MTLNFILGVYNTYSAVNTSLTLIVKYNQGQTQRFSIPFIEYPKATLSIFGVTTPTVRVGDGADYVTLTVKNTGLCQPNSSHSPFYPQTCSRSACHQARTHYSRECSKRQCRHTCLVKRQ
ncbi:hypothetical protein B9Q04_03520, partial [Candidatus Marsarchaeota G2 archaeon BE_D]